MNKELALQQIDLLISAKKLSKNSLAYQSIIEAINNPGKPVSCGKSVGSGRFSSSKSWINPVVVALQQTSIPYVATNMAPKGGKAGDTITLNF